MGLVFTPGEGASKRFGYNTHHSPLPALGASAALLVFGVHDWAARIFPATCSIASTLILFFLWRRYRGDLIAALAAVVMATLPAFGHFGKMLGEEAPTLMFGLLSILFYRCWAEARSGRTRPHLVGCLAAYAAACLSGWAAFHIGPILMVDAALTLRGKRRFRVLVGVGLTGLLVLVLILAHFALLTGSLADIVDAASSRTVRTPTGLSSEEDLLSLYLRQERSHFLRLFGWEAAALGSVCLLSGLIALARGRARGGPVATVLILAAFGVAHPIIFPWAAYIHDWVLFHLLPVMAIAAAEGILLLASILSSGMRILRVPNRVVTVVAVLVVTLLLGHRAALGVRGLRILATEESMYAWPFLGKEMARGTSGGSRLMANFRVTSAPLRFYADRPIRVVLGFEELEALLPRGLHTRYVQDRNIPIEPALEARLREHPSRDVLSYRIYDLERSRPESSAATAGPGLPEGASVWGSPLEVEFPGTLRLTSYEVITPPAPPDPVSWTRRFLGSYGGSLSSARVVLVQSTWDSLTDDLPDWSLFVAVARPKADGSWTGLPLLTVPEHKRPRIARWSGHSRFRIETAFLFPVGFPAAEYQVRFLLYDGGRPITPTIPGPPVQGLKAVVAGTISLFAEAEPAGVLAERRESPAADRDGLPQAPTHASGGAPHRSPLGKAAQALLEGRGLPLGHDASGGLPVAALLERIQDEGFHEEANEIIHGSDEIRRGLEAEGTLRALALLHQAALWAGDEPLRRETEAKLDALDLVRVNQGDKLLYLGSEMEFLEWGETRISWWFKVTGRMRTDYRMFLHGYVKDKRILPEHRKQYEFANFDHDVHPPTSRWKTGEIVRHTWTGRINSGEYRFLFGFYNSRKKRSLKVEGKKDAAVEMGWRVIPNSQGS
jgi:4-amino-4-deoxy-L-arabinose transferase-like glycosyltransferase